MPFAYAVMFKQLMKEELLNKIVVTIFMVILFLAAILLLKNGITGLITNGKNHLVLTEDNLKIIVNSGRYKGTIHSIKYAQIKGFYFISNKTAKDKTTGKYYIKEGSSGTINLYAHNEFYCAEIYNARRAATRILSKLEKSQIDNERNELDPYGNYTPKDLSLIHISEPTRP